jgi:hypothetical protein
LKVLLLHSDDTLPVTRPERWDLIVDFARTPIAVHESWAKRADCPVFDLCQFAEEIVDLHRVRQLLQLGMGYMVDQWGIDWWGVLSLEIVPQLQQFMLLQRLSKRLSAGCELYSSRPHLLATALSRLRGTQLTILESRAQTFFHRAHHYHDACSRLDISQLRQVLQDKFDINQSIRRHFAHRHISRQPIVLLPSAYINASRTATSYAELLPDHQFLLVHTRSNARLTAPPKNVRSVSLTPYFVPTDKRQINCLLESWNVLRKHLVHGAEEFKIADAVGVLRRIPALLRWGIDLRDAWNQFFQCQDVTACLCGDDSNPPSSIPLILAKQRGLPALAFHHGALDYKMAIKVNHADFYLAKSEMETDYMRRVCHLAPEKIVVARPASSRRLPLQRMARRSAPWLVFFTEPYQNYGWRTDEVYRDLLPRLHSLAQNSGLKLVFKLHPFESVKGHRSMLRRLIPVHEHEIDVLAGPPTEQLWNNTRLALTVQSSTALECAALGIPVFLCAWLRDPYTGYVQQYARFGAGHILDSAEQISEIPQLLEQNGKSLIPRVSSTTIDADDFAQLLSGACCTPLASNA